MKKTKIRKAVIPIAGKGTRVMPLTLHQPKTMVSVVDRPILHYVVDEAIGAGANHIIIVAGPDHPAHVKKYLDFLKGDPEWKKVRFDIVIQREPLGNGHALLSAEKLIAGEPFLLLFSDDILAPHPKARAPMRDLTTLFDKVQEPIIALQELPWKDVVRMGVVKPKKTKAPNVYALEDIIEKPAREKAPSNLTAVGRYIITPDVLKNIKTLYKKKQFSPRGEIELVDGFRMHLEEGGKLYGWKFPNERFDCGSKIGIAKAHAYFTLHHPEFRKEFRAYLKKLKM